jgi:hypothetical protein
MSTICLERNQWLLHVFRELSLKNTEVGDIGADSLQGIGFSKLEEETDPRLFLSALSAQKWFDQHPEAVAVIVNNPCGKTFGTSQKLHPWVPFLRCRQDLPGSTSRVVAFWFALIFDLGVGILSAEN